MSEIIIASVILAGAYSVWKAVGCYYRLKREEANLEFLREMCKELLPSKLPSTPKLTPEYNTLTTAKNDL